MPRARQAQQVEDLSPRARARQAVLAVARAEIDDVGSRRELYSAAMHAVRAAHPGLADEEICSATYAEVTHQIWLKDGKERGIAEDDCAPAKAWFWRVGESLGYTGKYSRYDVDGAGANSTSIIEEASSLISEELGGEEAAPAAEGSREAIEAIGELRSALHEAAAFLYAHDATALAGADAVETFVTEARALSRAATQMMAENRTVPAGLRPLLVSMVHMAQSMDALVRRFTSAWREAGLDGHARLTPKGLSKILKGRSMEVPPCEEPRSFFAAVLRGYHGAKCPDPKCGSRRVRDDPGGRSVPTLHCLACKAQFGAPEWATCRACHRLLGDALRDGDVDCPHCGEPTRAPPGAAGRDWLAP